MGEYATVKVVAGLLANVALFMRLGTFVTSQSNRSAHLSVIIPTPRVAACTLFCNPGYEKMVIFLVVQ